MNACMLICCHCLPTLDSNDTESTEGKEVFGYQGEDQGQANQGKPSKLVAYLIPVFILCIFINDHESACFILLLLLDSNYW
jgi:hypothetical protein